MNHLSLGEAITEFYLDFKAKFELCFIDDNRFVDYMLSGLGNTLKITFFALIIGVVLQEARLDSNSEVTLNRPQGDFSVLFDGGAGHSVEVRGDSLVR